MKIGIITSGNPKDRKAWSGTLYKMYKKLCDIYGEDNVIHLQTHMDVLADFGISFISVSQKYLRNSILL